MMYDAPTTRALTFFDHDLVGDVRTACERRAAQDNPVATTAMRTRKRYASSDTVLSTRDESMTLESYEHCLLFTNNTYSITRFAVQCHSRLQT